jgi:hypothetical protein
MEKTPIPRNIPFQNIQKGSSTIGYVDKLIEFFERVLPRFPIEKQLKKEQNENDLTENLYNFLTRSARAKSLPFEFHPEKSQKQQKGHPKRVDLAIKLNTLDVDMDVIYCLEAKKLPTDRPKGKREKEYVIGKGGGIERFKNEAHGKDDQGNLLPRSGIVAYLTQGSFEHWYAEVNSWIVEAGWQDSEKLIAEYFAEITKLKSNHLRVSGSTIELTHFWVSI